MAKILCVEDNPEVRILVEAALSPMEVMFATTVHAAREMLEVGRFDLIILDLELPDGDGLKLLTGIQSTPVFILTGKGEIANKIIAFSVGADDFITKPFDPLELKARVNGKIQKSQKAVSEADQFKVGDLLISVSKQKIWQQKGDEKTEIVTTAREFRLLLVFARSPERVFSRDQLLNEVWGTEANVTDRTVDTHVGHVRKKLKNSKRIKIETVIGEGYRLVLLS